MTSYTQAVCARAMSYIGDMEVAHNSGVNIDRWLGYVDRKPGNEWCMAALHGWFYEVAQEQMRACPVPRTAGVLDCWRKLATHQQALTPAPGRAVFMDYGASKGHVELVIAPGLHGYILSVGGNTNVDGSRVGNAVWAHVWNPAHGMRGKLLGYAGFEAQLS